MTHSFDDELAQGYAALDEKRYGSARCALERALKNGVHLAALPLGWLWEQGLGGPKDLGRARSLYELALVHDRKLGSYYLGSLLIRTGEIHASRQLLEQAAALGHPSAAYWAYAMNLDEGNGERSRELLDLAACLGHAFARRDLARVEMREADSMGKWVTATGRYLAAKWHGALYVARDVDDPRVR